MCVLCFRAQMNHIWHNICFTIFRWQSIMLAVVFTYSRGVPIIGLAADAAIFQKNVRTSFENL